MSGGSLFISKVTHGIFVESSKVTHGNIMGRLLTEYLLSEGIAVGLLTEHLFPELKAIWLLTENCSLSYKQLGYSRNICVTDSLISPI